MDILLTNGMKYTQGQYFSISENDYGFGNGDLVGHAIDTASYGGPSTNADEGNEAMRFNSYEQGVVFSATLSSIVSGSDHSATISTSLQANAQSQGEGRMLIDISGKINAGYISSIGPSGGNIVVTCSGCSLPGSSSTQTTLTTAVQNTTLGCSSSTNCFPASNVTLTVGSTAGFAVNTIACIFDYDYECEYITAIGAGTITIATDRLPHAANAYVVTGGLTGYAWEAVADEVCATTTGSCLGLNGISGPTDSNLASTVRWAIPIMMSNSSAGTVTLFSGYNFLPGTGNGGYGGRAYTSMGSGGSVTLTIMGGAVTSCSASGGTNYGGASSPPQVNIAGSWTTAPAVTAFGNGALSACTVLAPGSGITGTPTVSVVPTNGYAIYPAAKVYSVYNQSLGRVDGTIYTEPPAGTFNASDIIEEPHWFIQRTNGANNGVGQYIPAHQNEPHFGLSYALGGIWENTDFALGFSNNTQASVYAGNPYSAPWVLGQGQLIPPQGTQLRGPFTNAIYMDTPPSGLGEYAFVGSGAIQIACGPGSCANWTQSYNFLNASNGNNGQGEDVLSYNPKSQAWSLTSQAAYENGGGPGRAFSFSGSGFADSGLGASTSPVCPNGAGNALTTAGCQVALSGTTPSIGGSALSAGACSSATASVTGSTTSMAVEATPSTYPGDPIYWKAYVSSAGTVTVKVCAAVAATPTASTYNVRVIQ